LPLSRRALLKLGGALPLYLALPGLARGDDADREQHRFLNVRPKVGDPENV
jgi:uncharacterized protein (DUF1501 family)